MPLRKLEQALTVLVAGSDEDAAIRTFWWGVIKPLHQRVMDNAPFPIAAVRQGEMMWNRQALEAMPLREVVGVMVHEAHHLIRWAFDRDTVGREVWEEAVSRLGEEQAHVLMNIAQDMHINADLVADGYSLPAGVIDMPPLGPFEEATFKKLLHGPMKPAGFTIDFEPGWMRKEDVQDWVVDAGRRAGRVPASYEGVVAPRRVEVDWREVLRQYMLREVAARAERTWARPNRRMAGLGHMMPQECRDKGLGRLVFGIDTSGSMSRSLVGQAIGVVRGVVEEVGCDSARVVYADATVQRVAELGEDLSRVVGGGGTLLGPVLEWCETEGCDLLIHVSDMEIGDRPAAPRFPVVFVAPPGAEWPWGHIVHALKDMP